MSDEIAQVSTCWCETCRPITLQDMRMVLCPKCGNKRCPRATNHIYQCTAESYIPMHREKGNEMKIELTPAVVACLKRGLNCWPQQNFADGAEIRDILRMNFLLVKALASQAPLATTHYEGCWDSGPRHYECALLQVKRLRREWVGLTEEEKHDCYLKIDVWSRCVEAIEAKLKEKNGG